MGDAFSVPFILSLFYNGYIFQQNTRVYIIKENNSKPKSLSEHEFLDFFYKNDNNQSKVQEEF